MITIVYTFATLVLIIEIEVYISVLKDKPLSVIFIGNAIICLKTRVIWIEHFLRRAEKSTSSTRVNVRNDCYITTKH